MIRLVPKALRTVKYYIRYRPGSNIIVRLEYRTKKQAEAAQCVGEVIVQMKGHYLSNMVMRPRKRYYSRRRRLMVTHD
jgi:hypothetical protein